MNKVVHFGAGNIGRGFLGQLYSQSGWETAFVDVAPEVVQALNAQRSYDISILENTPSTVHVDNVRAVDGRDASAVAQEIASANLLGTSVGVNALPYIVPALTKGLEARAAAAAGPITIVICENLLDAGQILKQMLVDAIADDARAYLESSVGFAETVISRMVPVATEAQRQQDPLYVGVEAFARLPIDRRGFLGDPPAITGFEYHDGLVAYEERKIFTHNCGHALCAYFGYEKGYVYIWEAVGDAALRERVLAGLWESGHGLCHKHGFTRDEHQAHIDDLLRRFANRALGDTVARVGRDPIRKLGPKDRLVGSAKLALEYGQAPKVLVNGIVSALRYDHADDEKAVALQEMLNTDGLDRVLTEVCGLQEGDALYRMIADHYAG